MLCSHRGACSAADWLCGVEPSGNGGRLLGLSSHSRAACTAGSLQLPHIGTHSACLPVYRYASQKLSTEKQRRVMDGLGSSTKKQRFRQLVAAKGSVTATHQEMAQV